MTAPRFEGDDSLERILDDLVAPELALTLAREAGTVLCAVCLGVEWVVDVERTGPNDAEQVPRHPAHHEFEPLTPALELRKMLEAAREPALWRFGRAMQRMAGQDAELRRYLEMIRDEVGFERERLAKRMAALDAIVKEELLRRRREDPDVKSILIPGVGRWTSTKRPPSWRTDDEAAVVASLADTPDEFQLYTEATEGRRLLKDDFKKYLVESGFEAFPGMTRTAEHIATKGPFDDDR